MRRRFLSVPTLSLLLATPAFAGVEDPAEDGGELVFDFLTVVDSNELPQEMVDALDLDVDGPVIIASAHISDAFEDMWLRYDAVKDELGPLARFHDLEVMADVFWDVSVPVVISDFLDGDDLADAVYEGMPAEQLRIVFDPAFMNSDLGSRVTINFNGDVVATVEDNLLGGPEVPIQTFRGTNFVDNTAHAEDVYERSLPSPDEYAFYGFLCQGLDDGGPCAIAHDISASAEIYISLNPTEDPEDGPTGAPAEEPVEEPEGGPTDTSPPATDTAPDVEEPAPVQRRNPGKR